MDRSSRVAGSHEDRAGIAIPRKFARNGGPLSVELRSVGEFRHLNFSVPIPLTGAARTTTWGPGGGVGSQEGRLENGVLGADSVQKHRDEAPRIGKAIPNRNIVLNLHRRHLSASQRGCLATETLPMMEAEAEALEFRRDSGRGKLFRFGGLGSGRHGLMIARAVSRHHCGKGG